MYNVSDVCGFDAYVTSQPQMIASPNFPFFYENNLNCLWRLAVNNYDVISVAFIGFSTESAADHVEVSFFQKRFLRGIYIGALRIVFYLVFKKIVLIKMCCSLKYMLVRSVQRKFKVQNKGWESFSSCGRFV